MEKDEDEKAFDESEKLREAECCGNCHWCFSLDEQYYEITSRFCFKKIKCGVRRSTVDDTEVCGQFSKEHVTYKEVPIQ